MRDEERIDLYYRFGLLDWKNELQAIKRQQKRKKLSRKLFLKIKLVIHKIFRFKKFRTSAARRLARLLPPARGRFSVCKRRDSR